jgi:hypothetical protein
LRSLGWRVRMRDRLGRIGHQTLPDRKRHPARIDG